MVLNARQSAILDLLRDEQRVNVAKLASHFSVSEMTIRRDLSTLSDKGFLVRTHGGGVAAGKMRFLQSAFPTNEPSPLKVGIGRAAAQLVESGQTIMIEAGSTALEVARHLPHDASLTVATTSLCVAQELYRTPVNVLILGGFLRKDHPSLYGPLTESIVKDFHVDTLFMGCDGASADDGFYSIDLHISSLEQAMMEIASKIVIVAESVKFTRRAFVRYATLQQVHTLVTDAYLSEEDREKLKDKGVNLIIAE
jgi:DeoR/GlpR family transcriptional regulator of sugar metabolism